MKQTQETTSHQIQLPKDFGDICFIFGSKQLKILPEFWTELNAAGKMILIAEVMSAMDKLREYVIHSIIQELPEELQINEPEEDLATEDVPSKSKH